MTKQAEPQKRTAKPKAPRNKRHLDRKEIVSAIDYVLDDWKGYAGKKLHLKRWAIDWHSLHRLQDLVNRIR